MRYSEPTMTRRKPRKPAAAKAAAAAKQQQQQRGASHSPASSSPATTASGSSSKPGSSPLPPSPHYQQAQLPAGGAAPGPCGGCAPAYDMPAVAEQSSGELTTLRGSLSLTLSPLTLWDSLPRPQPSMPPAAPAAEQQVQQVQQQQVQPPFFDEGAAFAAGARDAARWEQQHFAAGVRDAARWEQQRQPYAGPHKQQAQQDAQRAASASMPAAARMFFTAQPQPVLLTTVQRQQQGQQGQQQQQAQQQGRRGGSPTWARLPSEQQQGPQECDGAALMSRYATWPRMALEASYFTPSTMDELPAASSGFVRGQRPRAQLPPHWTGEGLSASTVAAVAAALEADPPSPLLAAHTPQAAEAGAVGAGGRLPCPLAAAATATRPLAAAAGASAGEEAGELGELMQWESLGVAGGGGGGEEEACPMAHMFGCWYSFRL